MGRRGAIASVVGVIALGIGIFAYHQTSRSGFGKLIEGLDRDIDRAQSEVVEIKEQVAQFGYTSLTTLAQLHDLTAPLSTLGTPDETYDLIIRDSAAALRNAVTTATSLAETAELEKQLIGIVREAQLVVRRVTRIDNPSAAPAEINSTKQKLDLVEKTSFGGSKLLVEFKKKSAQQQKSIDEAAVRITGLKGQLGEPHDEEGRRVKRKLDLAASANALQRDIIDRQSKIISRMGANMIRISDIARAQEEVFKGWEK